VFRHAGLRRRVLWRNVLLSRARSHACLSAHRLPHRWPMASSPMGKRLSPDIG
jgi:hypothetical protein